MDSKLFTLGLRTISTVLPYAKKLPDDEASFLWMTLDSSIKEQVSDQMWAYACKRFIERGERNEQLSIHLDILSLIYKCENGRPNFTWGLKFSDQDLIEGCKLAKKNKQGLSPCDYAKQLAESRKNSHTPSLSPADKKTTDAHQ